MRGGDALKAGSATFFVFIEVGIIMEADFRLRDGKHPVSHYNGKQ